MDPSDRRLGPPSGPARCRGAVLTVGRLRVAVIRVSHAGIEAAPHRDQEDWPWRLVVAALGTPRRRPATVPASTISSTEAREDKGTDARPRSVRPGGVDLGDVDA